MTYHSGPGSVSRRRILRAAGGISALVPLGLAAPAVFASSRFAALPAELAAPPICKASAPVPVTVLPGAPRKLKLTWNASAICTAGVPVAAATGLFTKHNLDVELINFGGSTDQLLEAIASGKADAGIGMALRWLKPLEQGFDVRITTATHGGCMRLLTSKTSGIQTLSDLKGKTIGVTDMAAPDKNFFSIRLAKLGFDPNSDVQFRVFPGDLLPVALKKGEVDAFTLGDPLGWVIRERDDLHEAASNLDGEYAHRACCVLGVRGGLIRDDKAAAAALTEAVLEAQDFVHDNPEETARIFAPYSPVAKPDQLAQMLRSHTHGHHPVGSDLKQEIALYIDELKAISVIKPSTNSERFSDKVFADVLS
jgi:NitT/TauT family transport system substrate-binding protein